MTLAVEAALHSAPVTTLISVGLAGGCSPSLASGVVEEVALVIDARTGERFVSSTATSGPTLATIDAVAGVQEKARLAATYGAALVDMEAATVGRLAAANGLHFRAIKAVSDAHDFELASLAHFSGSAASSEPRPSLCISRCVPSTGPRPCNWVATAIARSPH